MISLYSNLVESQLSFDSNLIPLLELVKASVLAECSPLFIELAKVAPNTLLPSLKFQTALLVEHQKSPILKGIVGSLENTMSTTGATIRMLFSHYREIAKFSKKKRTCFRKAP